MSPELKALVERVMAAMNDAALTARTQNPDIPDEEYDAAQALAAIRCVAEAAREASEAQMDAWENIKHPPHHENRLATKQASIWRAMHAASVLGEALRHE